MLRAYSIASANHEEHLEFLSIKVPGGPLTSRLQHIRSGDEVLISRKPTGTLLLCGPEPGATAVPAEHRHRRGTLHGPDQGPGGLRALRTGDPGARGALGERERGDRAARSTQLRAHELLGEAVRAQLLYYPSVTREPHPHHGRLTRLMHSGQLFADLGIAGLDAADDRAMVCGSAAMLADTCALLDEHGLRASPGIGEPGDYVIERAFVTR